MDVCCPHHDLCLKFKPKSSIMSGPPSIHDISLEFTEDDDEMPFQEFAFTSNRNIISSDPKHPIIGAASCQNTPNDNVADLEPYIVEIYRETTFERLKCPIFDSRVGHSRPQLQKDRKNRIIVYGGCFNPPHRGHQALLNHAFSCSQDLNVIAAFVIPLSDKSIRSKPHANEVCFSVTERARLWVGDDGPHEWLWVWEHGSRAWEKFQEALRGKLAEDGFLVEYISLYGPDNIEKPTTPVAWPGCDNIIVSDAGRKAGFVRADGTLGRLGDCGSWKPISHLEKRAIHKARETARWLLNSLSFTMIGKEAYEGLIEEIKLEYIRRMRGVRVSHRISQSRRWVRFIPSKSKDPIAVSSTDIQSIIRTCRLACMFEKLQGKALYPRILMKLIWEKR